MSTHNIRRGNVSEATWNLEKYHNAHKQKLEAKCSIHENFKDKFVTKAAVRVTAYINTSFLTKFHIK